MILHAEDGFAVERDAAIAAVEERDVRFGHAVGQRRRIHREAVIHRDNLDLAGGEVLDRMVGAVMALGHLFGFAAQRQAQHLMAQADAE